MSMLIRDARRGDEPQIAAMIRALADFERAPEQCTVTESQLTAALFDEKRVRRYVQAITPAQEALGILNDVGVAGEMYRTMTFSDPQAWFAVGWLSSRRDEIVLTCVRPLRDAAKAKPYWKH